LYVASAFIANVGLQIVGVLISWRLGRVPALTIGLVSGNRNMAVVIANLGSAATPEIALFFAAVQFPIYRCLRCSRRSTVCWASRFRRHASRREARSTAFASSKAQPHPQHLERIEVEFRIERALDIGGLAKPVLLAREQKVTDRNAVAAQRLDHSLGLIGRHYLVLV